MDAWDAGGPELLDLSRGIVDAELAYGFVVLAEAVELGVEVGRDPGAAEGGEAANLRGAEHG